ncbi:MAG TPA: TonB-dependent receptor, partial [Puia sp.]
PNGSVAQSPLLLDPLHRVWLRNVEQDFSGYVHTSYHRTIKGRDLNFSAGGMYRAKDRSNFYNSYTFQPAITDSFGQRFVDIYHATWTNNNGPQDPYGAVANPNTYTAQEYIGAAYAAVNFTGKKMEWTAGLRYENTRQQFVSSVDPTVSFGKQGSIRYDDYLPSVQLKFRLDERQLLRASWYRSLSRPALYDVTFYSVTYEDYLEAGNPFLKRSRADNVDLRYEWYSGKLDYIQTGVFYKHINDPYEKVLLNAGDELYPLPSQGLSYTAAGELTAQMRNAPSVNDYGIEFAAAKYVGKIGVQVQYSYVHSRVDVPVKFKTRQDPADPSSDLVTVTKYESRPLQGQSPHLAGFSLMYRDDRKGWRGRVTAVYTGRRIYSASGWLGLDYWQRAYTVLDVSMEKRLGRYTKVFVKVNNLFNTITTVDLRAPNPEYSSAYIPGQQSAGRITVMRQVDKAAYYAGVEWRMP